MHALSTRRIESMAARYIAVAPPAEAEGRVRLAIEVAVAVMLDDVVAGHHDIDPTFEIERLTGQPPHSFTDFIQAHRAQFAG